MYKYGSGRKFSSCRFEASQCFFVCLFSGLVWSLIVVLLVGFHHHTHSKERTQKRRDANHFVLLRAACSSRSQWEQRKSEGWKEEGEVGECFKETTCVCGGWGGAKTKETEERERRTWCTHLLITFCRIVTQNFIFSEMGWESKQVEMLPRLNATSDRLGCSDMHEPAWRDPSDNDGFDFTAHRGSWGIKRNTERILLCLHFFGQHLSGGLGFEIRCQWMEKHLNTFTWISDWYVLSFGWNQLPYTTRFLLQVHTSPVLSRTREAFMASCSKTGTLCQIFKISLGFNKGASCDDLLLNFSLQSSDYTDIILVHLWAELLRILLD